MSLQFLSVARIDFEWNQCILVRLLRANVIAFRSSASVVGGFDLDVRSVSCHVCQRQFAVEENSRDLVTCPWVSECAWQNSSAD